MQQEKLVFGATQVVKMCNIDPLTKEASADGVLIASNHNGYIIPVVMSAKKRTSSEEEQKDQPWIRKPTRSCKDISGKPRYPVYSSYKKVREE